MSKNLINFKKKVIEKANNSDERYKVLIVDDDEYVHKVTIQTLKDFKFEDRTLEFVSAYSEAEAERTFLKNSDVAIILLDVIMESEDSGLKFVKFIREKLDNHLVRVILRTGQPWLIKEIDVVAKYDINDYKEKTELTDIKMFTTIYSALRSYRDLVTIEEKSRKLKEQERKYRLIVENQNDLIISFSKNLIVKFVNPNYCRVFGVDSSEIIGESLFKFIHSEDVSKVKKSLSKIFDKPHICSHEERALTLEGERCIYWSNRAILNQDGEVEEIVAVGRDITKLKEVERELQKHKNHLEDLVKERTEKLNRVNLNLSSSLKELQKTQALLIEQSKFIAMGEMMGNIAHQWRQPLNSISLIIQNIEMFYENGDLTLEYLEREVEKALNLISKMSRTIDDFRNFFFPNDSKEHFSVKKAISDSIEIIDATLKNLNIELKIELEKDSVVFGYRREFSQVILNLLSNSKDALMSKNFKDKFIKILIDYDDKKEKTIIEVYDNGGGVEDDIKEKIFEPYFSTKFKSEGIGIGLYMSKIMIEKNMQGKIYFENITCKSGDRGVKFRIEI